MYTFSLSVLLQALVVITMSGAADHGHYRKSLLLAFALTGAVATMLFLPTTSAVYGLGMLWAVITNVCLGATFVLLNAYLPLLVRWHPTMLATSANASQRPEVEAEDEGEDTMLDSSARLLPGSESAELPLPDIAITSRALQLSTRISSNGIGFGYLAALLVQAIAIAVVLSMGQSSFSLRLVLFLVGMWWLLLTLPAAYCLRPRPGPSLVVADKSGSSQTKRRSWIGYLTFSWTNLYRTAKQARRLKDVLIFLAAWFMISDAIATVSGTAILFAKTTLGMKPAALSMINVTATLCGVIGAFTWPRVSRIMGLTASQTILACICLFECIPLYGLLGYIPAIKRAGVVGLQQPWEMYPLGAVYGLVLGGLSSYCRSMFGELIPEGSEAAFFALFAVTDKGSSVFGPAIVGAITDATGDIRPSFWFLAVLIGMPIPLMMILDVERGKKEANALAKQLVPRGTHPQDRTPGSYEGRLDGDDSLEA